MATVSTSRASRRIRVWDLPLRLFHWLLAVAVAVAILSSEEDSALNQWHVMAGWVAAILVLFRIVWGFVGGEHSRFADFVRPGGLIHHVGGLLRGRPEPTVGHNALGALSVLLLLALVAATVWTGVTLSGEPHEVIAWTMLGLVGLHVAAVVAMSLMTRESLVAAMVTGSKPATRHPGARDARPPTVIGLILALLAVLGAIYAVLAYDPFAFTPRSAESYEHRASAGSGATPARPDEPGKRD
jgi:cytochrome b